MPANKKCSRSLPLAQSEQPTRPRLHILSEDRVGSLDEIGLEKGVRWSGTIAPLPEGSVQSHSGRSDGRTGAVTACFRLLEASRLV
jgi:hypothetical protein